MLRKFKDSSLSEIAKYTVAGIINTCVGYAVFWIALRWIGFGPAAANTIGYAIALSVSFLLNRFFVFSNSQPFIHAAGRFAIAFCIAFSLNQFVLFILLGTFLLSAEIAQIFAMAAYTLTFYFLSKYFVFVAKQKPALPIRNI
jgi:putative flippase GtrA